MPLWSKANTWSIPSGPPPAPAVPPQSAKARISKARFGQPRARAKNEVMDTPFFDLEQGIQLRLGVTGTRRQATSLSGRLGRRSLGRLAPPEHPGRWGAA